MVRKISTTKYLLLGNLDIEWELDMRKVERFREMWNQGASRSEIMRKLKINADTLNFLIYDQAENDFIEPRH